MLQRTLMRTLVDDWEFLTPDERKALVADIVGETRADEDVSRLPAERGLEVVHVWWLKCLPEKWIRPISHADSGARHVEK